MQPSVYICEKARPLLLLSLLIVYVVVLVMAGCARRTSTLNVRVMGGHHEQSIGQRPHNDIAAVGFTGDTGCYVAYEEEEEVSLLRKLVSFGRRQPAERVLFNGQPSPWFEHIVWMGFPFEDGRLFFVARAGKKVHLYQGLRQLGSYDEVCLAFGSSKDRKTLVYAVRRGSQWYIVRNGQETAVSGGAVTDLVLSPDGSKIAYVVQHGNQQTIIADGKPIGRYQKATLYFLSDDGKRLVYETRQGGKSFLVADGKQSPPYTRIRWLSLADDGQVECYVAQLGGRQFVVWQGKRLPPYDEVGIPSLSRDGTKLAYPARVGNRWAIVVNGQECGSYDEVASVKVSEDANLVAAAVRTGGQWFVVVNGRREGPYDSVQPALGPHGMRGPLVGLWPPVRAGSSNTRLGYAASDGSKWFVVVDGKRSAPYDHAFTPAFSRDGKHTAFVAVKRDNGLVVLDGKEGPQYDYIAAGPVFRKDGSLEYLAVRGETLYRVTVPFNLVQGASVNPR